MVAYLVLYITDHRLLNLDLSPPPSQAEIPAEYEQILYQFSYRTVADFTSIGSLSIMVTKAIDGDTAKLLAGYRETGQVSPKKPGSKPNVLCDTLRAYAGV